MRVARYALRRLVGLIPVIVGVTFLTFSISNIIPADPAAAIGGIYATEEQIQAIRQEYGLDKPFYVQYWNYLRRLVKGDLGYSYYRRRPVTQDLASFLPASLELALVSMALILPVGVVLGVIAGRHAGSAVDALTRIFAVLGVSCPVFWLALVMQLLFNLKLGWFPSGGRIAVDVPPPASITGFYLLDSLLTGNMRAFWSSLSHIAMPALTLAASNVLLLIRMTRSSLLEVLHHDYVRTARAKGLSERVVVYKHALRNALVPVVTVVGLQMGYLIAWVFLVEVVFSWPGIGRYAVMAIMGLDVPAITGVTLVGAAIYVLINLLVDVAYVVIDPRIKY